MFPMAPVTARERAASGTLKSEICLSVQHGPFLQEWEGLLEGCQGFLLMHRQNKIAFICRLLNNVRNSWEQTSTAFVNCMKMLSFYLEIFIIS